MRRETVSTAFRQSPYEWDDFVDGLERLADEKELYGGVVRYESGEGWPEELDSELDVCELEEMVEDLEEDKNTQKNIQVWVFTEKPEDINEDLEDLPPHVALTYHQDLLDYGEKAT